jgi:SAM-dependent methyltransferase
MTQRDPTHRFSSRVENYIKYRPGYPPAIVDLLKADCQLTADSVIADVGSGTGILTELFLKNGNRVFGVEPNREMREAAERLLAGYARFTSVAGRAESTLLDDRSVDFVMAGQAFHWFDQAQARREFARILWPGGWVVLVWNERCIEATPFLVAYEQLLQTYGTDYKEVDHKRITRDVLASFFAPAEYRQAAFGNRQVFDCAGLRGRLLSTSYAPEEGHPSYAPMLDALHAVFQAHQADGQVTFDYDTNVYYGQLQHGVRRL